MVLRWLLPIATRKGLSRGSRPWLYVAMLGGTIKLFRRIKSGPKVLYTTQIDPGEALVVSHRSSAMME